ncbi:uncharacterized protein E5676_scaffold602G00810 [Cucumis melo var. makuwa]|uniref:Uncharacterized protein n=1 Tax=Cucumis melo var. makuwa TaxID=1194695 RepID=A0A5A7VM26_CUCMM|nr:uncharacterized protein E6C27_scaffold21G004390 [Cucumis melo var. makuwa]TYK00915.1 uncharacterized protein E5676_scaffold602G00810 [Cucumis melo var. makuwa]
MHVKVLNGWSNKFFNMLVELLRVTFSMCSSIVPSSFYEAKRKLRDLGLGYKNIHAYDVLRHPADVEGWKHFDCEFSDFAFDPWNVHLGMRTYDSLTGQFFQLHVVLLWMVNDFSTYGNLSRWSAKGYQTCPICMSERSSFGIRGRIAFMGHRCYLPENHVCRRSRLHDGKVECRPHPMVMNGHEIL